MTPDLSYKSEEAGGTYRSSSSANIINGKETTKKSKEDRQNILQSFSRTFLPTGVASER